MPDYNLRGRLKADDDGRFEFETVVPSPYEVSHESAAPLTTQIYFEDDPWIDADVVGAVKASLITKLERHEGHAPCSYDFVLPPSHGSGEPSRH